MTSIVLSKSLGRSLRSPLATLLLLALAATSVHHFGAGPRTGDGHEYYLMLISIAEHGVPYATQETGAIYDAWISRRPASEHYSDCPYALMRDGYLHPLLRDDGTLDTQHFWFHPLLAVPFYWLLKFTGGDTALAFALLHLTLLGVALEYARRLLGAVGPAAAALVTLGAPTVWYLNRGHTEFFTVAITTIATTCVCRGRWGQASAWFAAASTQNPPFAILAVLSLLFGAAKAYRERRLRTLLVWALVAGALAALHPLYYLWRQGVVTPTLKTGLTNFSSLWPSWKRLTCNLIDPDIGLFPNWLLAAPLVGAAVVAGWKRRRAIDVRTLLFFALSGLVLAWAQTRGLNVNSGGTTGISRYALWYLFMFFALVVFVGPSLHRLSPRVAMVAAVAVLAGAALTGWNYRPSRPESCSAPSAFAKWLYAWAPWAYDPLPEIFYERRAGLGEVRVKNVPYFAASTPSGSKILVFRHDRVSGTRKLDLIPGDARLDPEAVRALAKELFARHPGREYFYINGRPEGLDRKGGLLQPGRTVSFAHASPRGPYLRNGWSAGEAWGVWSDGARADLDFRLADPRAGCQRLELRAVGYVPPGGAPRRVEAWLNGTRIGLAVFKATGPRDLVYLLPPGLLSYSNRLEFCIARPGPATREDGRLLGIGLISMRICSLYATMKLDFSSEDPAGSYGIGWSGFEGSESRRTTFRWATGPEATLFLELPDQELELEFWAWTHAGNPKQTMEVLVNGESVDKVPVPVTFPGQPLRRVVVAGSVLRRGVDRIGLRFAQWNQPDQQDRRKLAVAFEKLIVTLR